MKRNIVKARSELLATIRLFFTNRGFSEVTTPRVDREIIPEAHIDPYQVDDLGYLQASPEMHMKRLLCAGSGPIFEIATCFRRGERGRLHRPEFTMIEWYRPGHTMQAGMFLLDELIQHTLQTSPAKSISYRDAFRCSGVKVDPHTVSIDELKLFAPNFDCNDRDELLNYVLAKFVEPRMGEKTPELLYHYPASQSALASTTLDDQGQEVAERFELYYRGIELANGYHELTAPVELRRRLTEANAVRESDGRPRLPLPERLLSDMTTPGLPPCSGVALGFDRLLMLAVGADSLDEVCVN
ncbi:EF-P lysine aminoacylase EpmA [Aeoliella mucimassa]|uniref:Elongation factor P--(R)-beta-lysine ligase n=1 Tax=Aeoliella mucimassa TaxID=2527972 RepID=A0A518AJE8_9BACT|nr:EF-P lysine aminoacylase EpmA [Aeoliella mucimassa]QDU54845.1 Elongation factor P--(R)-beta-lysine ligase [Aeoliella mucimassa]